MTDEGAIDLRLNLASVLNLPLIRAAPPPTFSPKGRRV